jgi:hypothetical protein
VQAHAVAREDVAAGAGELDAAGEVDEPETFAQLDVGPGPEPSVRLECPVVLPSPGGPAADLDVVVGGLARGDVRIGGERDGEQDRVELGGDRRDLLVELLDPLLEPRGPGLDLLDLGLEIGPLVALGLLEAAHELPDLRAGLLGEPVLLGPEALLLGEGGPATGVEFEQAVDVDRHLLGGGAVAVAVGVLTQVFEVDHGATV